LGIRMDESNLASIESEFVDHCKLHGKSNVLPFNVLTKQVRSHDWEIDKRTQFNEVSFPSFQSGVDVLCPRFEQYWSPHSSQQTYGSAVSH